MFYNNIEPVLLSVGPITIRYYGLAYAVGLIMTYMFLRHIAQKEEDVRFNKNDVDDMFIYIMLGMIIGARLGYALIYNFTSYISEPLLIFQLWRGGMSFHGGLVGVVLAIILYVKVHNSKIGKDKRKETIEAYDITDVITIPAAFALALGRIANFTNHELYGRITDVPWAVNFRGVDGFRHPSQIYEAMYSVVIGLIQWALFTRKIAKGMMTWSFVTLYGVFRFITEFFRQPDVHMGTDGFFFGWMTTGHMLSAIMIVVGSIMIWKIYLRTIREYE